MPTKIVVLRKLPPTIRHKTSKYEALFDAAKRNPGKFVAVPNTTGADTAKKRGLLLVMRNRQRYVYAPRTARKRRAGK